MGPAPRRGGVLRVAVLGDPPTLDSHWTTANFVEVITQHIYEGLYTLDQTYQPIPDLADGMPAVSADGLTYAIKIRPGVRFHNGKELTSEDVASLKRWGGYAAQAKALWASVEDVRPAGKYAVELRLKETSGIVLISLANANNFAAIYPKEIAEKYPTPSKVTEYVGTLKFVMEGNRTATSGWSATTTTRPARSRPTVRQARSLTSTRSAGSRRPTCVPGATALESGDVEFADDLQADAYAKIKENSQSSGRSSCGRTPGPWRSSTRRKAS